MKAEQMLKLSGKLLDNLEREVKNHKLPAEEYVNQIESELVAKTEANLPAKLRHTYQENLARAISTIIGYMAQHGLSKSTLEAVDSETYTAISKSVDEMVRGK